MQKAIFFTAFFIFNILNVNGQSEKFTRYVNEYYAPTTIQDAVYRIEYEWQPAGYYKATNYTIATNALHGIGYYKDTVGDKSPVGEHLIFYEDGTIKLKRKFDDESRSIDSKYFYPSDKLHAERGIDPKTNQEKSVGYTEAGEIIKDFIIYREAEFKKGIGAWVAFLRSNLNANVPAKKAPLGLYKVQVKFSVDKDGSILDIAPLTNLGYGMEEEAIRVLKKSPKWMPAIYLNAPLKAYIGYNHSHFKLNKEYFMLKCVILKGQKLQISEGSKNYQSAYNFNFIKGV